jgi:hypothetical protein
MRDRVFWTKAADDAAQYRPPDVVDGGREQPGSRAVKIGEPGWVRTIDILIKSEALYH